MAGKSNHAASSVNGSDNLPAGVEPMSETRTVFDPFDGKVVSVRNDLILRLRGRYATGPTLPNGEPEFGWREFPTPPIQHEAAARIEELAASLSRMREALEPFVRWIEEIDGSDLRRLEDDKTVLFGATARVTYGTFRRARSAPMIREL